LLVGGSRTALTRHQTLKATLDWSYDLLSEQEQQLFRRVAAFAGGFTLQAAETICAGEGIEQAEVLDVLSQLVQKSLVVVEKQQGKEPRYRLLEPIRQYTVERLRSSGEEAEHDNLRAALAWSQRESSEIQPGLQLATALHMFWQMRGYISEGRKWLEIMLSRGREAPAPLRARVLSAAGFQTFHLGDFEQAIAYWEQALAM
jgi:predicted ATPase